MAAALAEEGGPSPFLYHLTIPFTLTPSLVTPAFAEVYLPYCLACPFALREIEGERTDLVVLLAIDLPTAQLWPG